MALPYLKVTLDCALYPGEIASLQAEATVFPKFLPVGFVTFKDLRTAVLAASANNTVDGSFHTSMAPGMSEATAIEVT